MNGKGECYHHTKQNGSPAREEVTGYSSDGRRGGVKRGGEGEEGDI